MKVGIHKTTLFMIPIMGKVLSVALSMIPVMALKHHRLFLPLINFLFNLAIWDYFYHGTDEYDSCCLLLYLNC